MGEMGRRSRASDSFASRIRLQHLIDMRINLLRCMLSLVALGVAGTPKIGHAQDGAGLVMPADVLRAIAVDFDAGRNPFYCYFGTRSAETPGQIRVDSVTRVATPMACTGNGLGFVSRVDDRFFLVNTLKGLIDAMPRLLVVSAFYRTEDLERDGHRLHTAHALSIIRGVSPLVANGGS